MDCLWKNISNEATNVFLYVNKLTRNMIKQIDKDAIRSGKFHKDMFAKFLTDTILKDLAGETDKREAFKEKEVKYNIEKIAPALWEELMDHMREDDYLAARVGKEEEKKRKESEREEMESNDWKLT